MLPNALAIGVPYETFWHLTPKKLKAFYNAHEIKRKIRDEDMWIMGMYVASALDSTVCNAFLWRKKGEKGHTYEEKPFLQKSEEKEHEKKNERPEYEGMTDEEKQKAELERAKDYFNSLIARF